MTQSPLAVTIFTDFASPHCYLTERALRAATAAGVAEAETETETETGTQTQTQTERETKTETEIGPATGAGAGAGTSTGPRVEIVYRALEMYPAGVALPGPAEIARLALDAESISPGLAAAPPAFGVRTRKAHEAARFAAEHAAGDRFRDAVFAAYWSGGLDIGRIDVLAGIAAEVGLDPDEMRIALDIDRFGEEVLRDAEVARRLRIRHVPTLYLGTGPGARILVGAQTAADLDSALRSR